MKLPQNLIDFEGRWSLTRTIRDEKAGQVVRADGHAVLSAKDDALIYEEEVTLYIPNQPAMKGTRKYVWRWAGDAIAVYFDDNRYFHRLTLGAQHSVDHHDCPPDSYDARYDFSAWPQWDVHWDVTGPRKSYKMHTEYMLR